MRRRTVLSGIASTSFPLLAGCSTLEGTAPSYRLASVVVQNRDAEEHDVTVGVTEGDSLVFLDSGVASAGEWSDGSLEREGGLVFEPPLAESGEYAVHVRVDDGPLRSVPTEGVVEDDGCLGVRPTVERGGGSHFSYVYEGCAENGA
ncbi:hypothetical protein [Haloprofundus halophilus]|uniref:hypothetical protein n=1 Tax=Haloprofundus halophilus TaxID=2283527 RepID=UPI000E44F7FB|nr:hypothetical protein [Haloprofundus halophilus]